jgi:pilus assembly protein Flp/PilA
MRSVFLNLPLCFCKFLLLENGQDLVEYALVVSLVAFGATAGMHTLATGLSGMFTKINAALTIV